MKDNGEEILIKPDDKCEVEKPFIAPYEDDGYPD